MQSNIVSHIILRPGTYFEDADNYVRLHKIYNPDDLLSQISIWIEMILSPLFTILSALYNQELPGVLSLIGIYKTVWLWIEWVLYKELSHEVSLWVSHVRELGGPFISTNNPSYQAFVYAHTMQKMHYSFFPKN
jgi:hypothetical protein